MTQVARGLLAGFETKGLIDLTVVAEEELIILSTKMQPQIFKSMLFITM